MFCKPWFGPPSNPIRWSWTIWEANKATNCARPWLGTHQCMPWHAHWLLSRSHIIGIVQGHGLRHMNAWLGMHTGYCQDRINYRQQWPAPDAWFGMHVLVAVRITYHRSAKPCRFASGSHHGGGFEQVGFCAMMCMFSTCHARNACLLGH